MVLSSFVLLGVVVSACATPVIYDGRAPYNYTGDDLNNSVDPYLSCVCIRIVILLALMFQFRVVKGSTENATYVSHRRYPTVVKYRFSAVHHSPGTLSGSDAALERIPVPMAASAESVVRHRTTDDDLHRQYLDLRSWR
jgi:hypothetical protein